MNKNNENKMATVPSFMNDGFLKITSHPGITTD
jgi:hypothetical protein